MGKLNQFMKERSHSYVMNVTKHVLKNITLIRHIELVNEEKKTF